MMARPRDLHDGKKTEQFMLRFPDDEALDIYRGAAAAGLPPAVYLRNLCRSGMYGVSRRPMVADNEKDSTYGLLAGAEE